MLTKLEKRVLYLLAKAGGQIQHYQISQATSRHTGRERDRALLSLESGLDLISSAQTPSKRGTGGAPGRTYWLTPAGFDAVQELVERGELKDPGPLPAQDVLAEDGA